MIFGTRHILKNYSDISVTYNNSVIERVDKFKYLGVILDPLLSWCDHVDYISTVVSKSIGVIRRVKILSTIKNSHNVSYCTGFSIF